MGKHRNGNGYGKGNGAFGGTANWNRNSEKVHQSVAEIFIYLYEYYEYYSR